MRELIFFAVNRPQASYFTAMAKQCGCPAETIWSRSLRVPCLSFWKEIGKLELDDLGRHSAEENYRKGRLPGWARPFYATLSATWFRIIALRYWNVFAEASYHTLAVWNGYHVRQAIAIRIARLHNKQIVYLENGPLPGTTTMDFRGINAANSLPRDPAFYRALPAPDPADIPSVLVPREPKNREKYANAEATLPERFVFVPFQVDHDTQLTVHSPWIGSMDSLFSVMEKAAASLPEGVHIVFKEHPSSPVDYPKLHQRAEVNHRLRFANGSSTQELICRAEAIVTINSTVGAEALLFGKRIVVLGEAYYGFEPLVRTAKNQGELEILLDSLDTWKPDTELIRKFISYLYNEYSLPGSWKSPDDLHFREAGKRLGCEERKEHDFYFVSTPFHLFNAISVALERPNEAHHLFFIDQPYGQPNRYFKALQAWQGSPFATIHFFDTRAKGLLRKLCVRKMAFRKIGTAVRRYRPGRIFTGNDRRIEYLFAYSEAIRVREGVTGAYLDDGVYSYIGEKSPWYKDSAIETLLKKLVYGSWYHRPRTVGSSHTVAEAYVAFPERVHLLLKSRKLFPLEAERLRGKPFTDYAKLLLEGEVSPETLASLDALVLLPHESVFADEPAFGESVKTTIRALGKKGLKTGIKYHPRQKHPDPLELREVSRVVFLPGAVPFEAMLPLLKRPIIVGDTSTVLLTAKWLRPELRTVSVKTGDLKRLLRLLELFTELGIEVTENIDRLELEKELS